MIKARCLSRQSGMTLVEILIAIAIAGILALLTVPHFLTKDSDQHRATVTDIEQRMAQIASTIQVYMDEQHVSEIPLGINLPPDEITLGRIYLDYGNYFALKTANGLPGGYEYLMLSDGSRIIIDPKILTTGSQPDTFPEYTARVLELNQWGPDGIAAGTCGGFSDGNGDGDWLDPEDNLECLYLDINGKAPPNQIGQQGDIIPLRIDPETGSVRTLYQWALSETPGDTCRFISVYDYRANLPGAAGCPAIP